MKRLRLVLAVLALALLAWLLWPRVGRVVPHPPPAFVPAASPAAPASSHSTPPPPAVPRAPRSPLADALNSPATDIAADLRLVSNILETFRSNFPREGNPVGENAEITAALTGKNQLHLALIPPDHPAIDARGELCDRWGTPFFFHQLSGTRMELRSAGPDRKFYTADDVVLTP